MAKDDKVQKAEFNIGGRKLGGAGRFNQPVEKPKNLIGTLKRVWMTFGDQRNSFFLIFVLVIFSTLVSLSQPYLVGRATKVLELGKDSVNFNALKIILFILIGAYLVDVFMNFIQNFFMAGISQKIVKNLRDLLYDKLQKIPIKYFDTVATGDTMSRLTNDVDNISVTISSSTIQLMNNAIMIIGSFIMMLSLSKVLTFASLITIPLVFILTKIVAKNTKVFFKDQQVALGKLNGVIEESISGVELVKGFNQEEKIINSFDELNNEYKIQAYKAQVWSGILMPFINVINNLGFATVATVGGFLAARGTIPVWIIASFLIYSKQFIRPLNDIANIFNTLQSAVAGAERVFELMDEQEEVDDVENAKLLQCVKGHVVFEDVSFGYNEKSLILKNVSFEAKPGMSIALVGATGSGKTTIVNLISRFYDVTSGTIKIDDIDVRQYNRDSLRRAFGIVLQDTYLFSGTIKDNIKYGKLNATDDEIESAAKMSNAHSFINRLPAGYDTFIAEGGSNLSAGQKQLLAIARAILANTPILILDEATSNVDTRTELKIQEAMLKLMSGRTSFIIAHRLSTIREADLIMVIENGEIIEKGNHNELMSLGGKYYSLNSIK